MLDNNGHEFETYLDEAEANEINVVPLADVSLVLLIILMILSPAIRQSMIKVQTPSAVRGESRKNPEAAEPLLIELRPEGIFLNNTPVPSDLDLAVQLALKLSNAPERPVLVSADPGIMVERVVGVLDLAKQHGARKVSLLKKAEAA